MVVKSLLNVCVFRSVGLSRFVNLISQKLFDTAQTKLAYLLQFEFFYHIYGLF